MRCLLCLLATTTMLWGCDAPIVGEWESDRELDNGKRNKMEVLDDNTGTATIYATANTTSSWIKFKFDIEWEDFDSEFELSMDCDDGPCDGNDFKMDCEVIEDEDDDGFEKADCKGNKNWKSYPFDWQRADE